MSHIDDATTDVTPAALHVVIPAAGKSRRMGQPKLLMPILGTPLIKWLVESLVHPRIASVSILIRPNDVALRQAIEKLDVQAVVADSQTSDMKESVECLIEHLKKSAHPQPQDGWMLIPADHPVVDREVLAGVIDTWLQSPDQVVVPTCLGKRGHPVIFPWTLIDRLKQIPPEHGLNWLLQQSDVAVRERFCENPSIHWDVDTPADFERVRQFLEKQFQAR